METDVIGEILKKGVPRVKTREALNDLDLLTRFLRKHIPKSRIPCSWCERAVIFRHCGVILTRLNGKSKVQNTASVLR